MAYNKHLWVTGETITENKLNNIENKIQDLDSGDNNYDFIIEQNPNESGSYFSVKGSFNDLVTIMQTRPIFGLARFNITTGGQMSRFCVPISYVLYYPSAGALYLYGVYCQAQNEFGYVTFMWKYQNNQDIITRF